MNQFRPVLTANFLLPLAAAQVLGYSPKQMRNLLEHGVIDHLVHRVGCGAFYLPAELLKFRRQLRLDAEFRTFVDEIAGEDEDES